MSCIPPNTTKAKPIKARIAKSLFCPKTLCLNAIFTGLISTLVPAMALANESINQNMDHKRGSVGEGVSDSTGFNTSYANKDTDSIDNVININNVVNKVESEPTYDILNDKPTTTLWQTLLPSRIFDGYWAATAPIDGMGVVVDYEPDGSITLHEYDCSRPYHPNVSVKSDFDIRLRLIPTDDDNVINVYSYNRQRINSQIQNIQIIGNMLDIEQVFVSRRPKLTIPYTYKHSETLTPICNHDKRKKE